MHYLIIAVLAFGLSLMGCEGKTGPAGPAGSAGQAGAAGPKGDTGPQGPPGTPGAKGDKGDKGDPGPKGDKGDTGDTGPQGPKGDTGDPASIDPGDLGSILADVHHVLVTLPGQAAKDGRKYTAPDFDDNDGKAIGAIPLLVDGTTTLTAKAATQAGTAIQNVAYAWSSKDDAIASVDAMGMVSGESAGSTEIHLDVVGRGIKVKIKITVYKAIKSVVATNAGESTLGVGDTAMFSAKAYDEEDTDLDDDNVVNVPGLTFTWASSNSAVATVKADKDDSAKATVTAAGAGTAKITASTHGKTSKAITITVFAVQTTERRLIASADDLPFAVTLDADSSDVETSDNVVVLLQKKGNDGNWTNLTVSKTVTFSVQSGAYVIASAQSNVTSENGMFTLNLGTDNSTGTGSAATTGWKRTGTGDNAKINPGTVIIKATEEVAGSIYIRVTIKKPSSSG